MIMVYDQLYVLITNTIQKMLYSCKMYLENFKGLTSEVFFTVVVLKQLKIYKQIHTQKYLKEVLLQYIYKKEKIPSKSKMYRIKYMTQLNKLETILL